LVEGLGNLASWKLTGGQAHDATQAVIPPRSNRQSSRPYDHHLYKDRNLVERFFNRLKHYRRVATRYDKLARNYCAFIAIVSVWVWLA
jgi:transposase